MKPAFGRLDPDATLPMTYWTHLMAAPEATLPGSDRMRALDLVERTARHAAQQMRQCLADMDFEGSHATAGVYLDAVIEPLYRSGDVSEADWVRWSDGLETGVLATDFRVRRFVDTVHAEIARFVAWPDSSTAILSRFLEVPRRDIAIVTGAPNGRILLGYGDICYMVLERERVRAVAREHLLKSPVDAITHHEGIVRKFVAPGVDIDSAFLAIAMTEDADEAAACARAIIPRMDAMADAVLDGDDDWTPYLLAGLAEQTEASWFGEYLVLRIVRFDAAVLDPDT